MLALVSFQLSSMYLLSLKINAEKIKKELVFMVPFILKKFQFMFAHDGRGF